MLYFLFFFCLRDGRHLEVHAPATLHGIFTMHMLIEVSRILEGAGARHVACSLKFGCPHRDLPTEEKKKQQRKYPKENQDIGFEVKIQRGITLRILNEIMRF
jgi:hypothetical protein